MSHGERITPRTPEELQYAHDVLVVAASKCNHPIAIATARQFLDVLCWALQHGDGDQFGKYIAEIVDALEQQEGVRVVPPWEQN